MQVQVGGPKQSCSSRRVYACREVTTSCSHVCKHSFIQFRLTAKIILYICLNYMTQKLPTLLRYSLVRLHEFSWGGTKGGHHKRSDMGETLQQGQGKGRETDTSYDSVVARRSLRTVARLLGGLFARVGQAGCIRMLPTDWRGRLVILSRGWRSRRFRC